MAALWQDGRKKAIREYLSRLGEKRHLAQEEGDRLEDAIDRLHDLRNYPFKTVELSSDIDEEQVAEVFVRINSEGVTLNQADFILTLMSVHWDQGRRELENFARACKQPTLTAASPFNWFMRPQPAQLLRLSVALAFRRAVLKHAYSLLRGKDLTSGRVDETRRREQFQELRAAQERVLDLTNWHEFLQCLERAGYRSSKMISSENAVIFSYALWLIGRVQFGVPLDKLATVIARWFFMAQLTSRYSGSFETQFEQDAARLPDPPGGGDFVGVLSRVVDDTLTSDFWSITLPNELATSASRSPSLFAYIAALNIHDADALLSTGKVRSRLDPAITAKKGIERHHLFPRGHLRKSLGIKDARQINQIAKMALVEWSDNINISDCPPHDYWPSQISAKGLPVERLARQRYWHALPDGWESMSYGDFLPARRRLMAEVVRDAYSKLSELTYAPIYPPASPPLDGTSRRAWTHHGIAVADLLDAGLISSGAVLVAAQEDHDVAAVVRDDGTIEVEDEVYDTPTGAAIAVKGSRVNGWEFWAADTRGGQLTLAALREELADSQQLQGDL